MSTKARKTVKVSEVLTAANNFLAAEGTFQPTADQRAGVASLLEYVLFSTGNYKGFNYLPSEKNEDGTLKPDYDDTRRFYYRKQV